MRYGYFDDAAREYVIERPDTPRSWSNYSGDRTYGAIYTNNGGGYSFYRSPAQGRFLRLTFNSVPADQPGRYFYLRDAESGDFWSSTWQPVGKSLETYASECRMGTAYLTVDSLYSGIRMQSKYFVPLDQAFEYWVLTVTNESERPRTLDLTTFCEFSSEWNIFQDALNHQYTAYTAMGEMRDGIVRASVCDRLPAAASFLDRDQGRWSFLSLSGDVSPEKHCLDREAFIGKYRSYANPSAIEHGIVENAEGYSDNVVGGLQTRLTLQPGESQTAVVCLGAGKAEETGAKVRAEYGTVARAEEEFAKLQAHWQGLLGQITVETPDPAFDSMVNVWNAYNTLMTFTWSRSCSLVYSGDQRDGFGYRDTVQDILGALPMIPGESKERLKLMLSGQESNGGARPEVDPLNHHPGKMAPIDPGQQRSDDCLWFFNSIPAYVAETGDTDFYREVVPYADAGEASVFQHLRKALEFNLERSGAHGLPCGLSADWNDCIKLGFKGESLFVAFQLRLGLQVYADIALALDEKEEAIWAKAQLAAFDEKLQLHAWDGQWFRRAYGEDGTLFGSEQCEEGKIFLNPQSWAIMSGAATAEQAESAMNAVAERLETDYGVAICAPAFKKISHHIMRAVLMNPGNKENGGIFSHTQPWAVIADCLIGQGDRAYQHLRSYLPAAQNDFADQREIEPYVFCQSTHGPESKKFGSSRVPWLSGAVTWSYYAMTQYVLGLRPESNGFRIDPCIPREWRSFSAKRNFRGMTLAISVENPDGVQKGVKQLSVNGETLEGDFAPLEKLSHGAKIIARMG